MKRKFKEMIGTTYWSSSKREYILISEMADEHLLNAAKKIYDKIASSTTLQNQPLSEQMQLLCTSFPQFRGLFEEIKRRGLYE
jgi:hypothetical protein